MTTRRSNNVITSVLLGAVLTGGSAIIADAQQSSRPPVTVTSVAAARSVTGPLVLTVPDPVLHPGATRRDLTKTKLCGPDFRTSQIRPPTSYTQKLKKLMLGDGGTIKAPNDRTYTVVGEHLPGTVADYELDHLISLQIGGHPEDPRNLWMEPWERKGARFAAPGTGAESKDVIENRLRREVCKNGLALSAAQQSIASDWTAAL